MTEIQLQQAVRSLLEADGWGVTMQWKLGAKRVDIVAFRRDEVNSFEVKLKDWRRASAQAFLNTPYFDRSYVVLPSNPRRRVQDRWFEDLGVGLLELDDLTGLHHVFDPPRRAVPEVVRSEHRTAFTVVP